MNGRSRQSKCCRRAAALAAALLAVAASAATADEAAVEKTLRQGLGALLDGDDALSLKHVRALLEQQPDFRLGRLIYADLLAARAHQDTLMAIPEALGKTRIKGLVEEAQARVHYRSPPRGYLPDAVMQLSRLHQYAFVLDAARARLYVLANKQGVPEPVADHYISTGNGGIGKADEGDEKTPLGVYHLTSYLDDDELPELYGAGAYPINYPNRWDRLKNRGGSGIWLHGTPRTVYSRPPQDSRGCVVLSNRLVADLASYIDAGRTPVVLARKIKWLKPEAWRAQQKPLLDAIAQWQRDWQSLDVERYLSHYSPNYRTAKQNYEQMAAATRRNAERKTSIEVELSDLDLFEYPGEADTVVASFDQNYRSNNYNLRYRKQQFWRHENGRWLIVFEGRAEINPPGKTS